MSFYIRYTVDGHYPITKPAGATIKAYCFGKGADGCTGFVITTVTLGGYANDYICDKCKRAEQEEARFLMDSITYDPEICTYGVYGGQHNWIDASTRTGDHGIILVQWCTNCTVHKVQGEKGKGSVRYTVRKYA